MRGCSVLFVCALCVFVLCGAAAVIAQEVTPEKMAAEAAKGIAKMATEKGEKAVADYRMFDSYVDITALILSRSINDMSNTKRTADTLSLPGQVPSKEEIKEEIGRLQTAMTGVKNAVVALKAPDGDSLSNQDKQYEIIYKMMEVWNKTEKAGKAADAVIDNDFAINAVITEAGELKATAFVTDEIPSIDAVIEKANELRAAAEKAMTLWTAAQGKLTTQLGELGAAFAAMNATINDVEEATKRFANNTSPETKNLNDELTRAVINALEPSLDPLTPIKTLLQSTKDFAGEAKNEYTALVAAAEELKEKAEERKQKVLIQHRLQQLQLHPH